SVGELARRISWVPAMAGVKGCGAGSRRLVTLVLPIMLDRTVRRAATVWRRRAWSRRASSFRVDCKVELRVDFVFSVSATVDFKVDFVRAMTVKESSLA